MYKGIDEVLAVLQRVSPEQVLLVGMGNPLKADDGIGSVICSQLHKTAPHNVIDAGIVPENYVQVIIEKNPDVVLFIDAIDFGALPGMIRVFKPHELSSGVFSTHILSPQLLNEIITHHTSPKVYFIGIQPKTTTIGQPMSREVERAKKELLELFVR